MKGIRRKRIARHILECFEENGGEADLETVMKYADITKGQAGQLLKMLGCRKVKVATGNYSRDRWAAPESGTYGNH